MPAGTASGVARSIGGTAGGGIVHARGPASPDDGAAAPAEPAAPEPVGPDAGIHFGPGPPTPTEHGRRRRRRTRRDDALVGASGPIPSWQVTLGVALLLLGFLIAAQLAAEGPRVRYTSQERTPLVETALALQAQQDTLKDRIVDLRDQIQAIEEGSAGLAGGRPRR